jgi:hypothetical protein
MSASAAGSKPQRLVRRQPLWSRAFLWPADKLLSLGEWWETLDWDSFGESKWFTVAGFACQLLYLGARLYTNSDSNISGHGAIGPESIIRRDRASHYSKEAWYDVFGDGSSKGGRLLGVDTIVMSNSLHCVICISC